MRRRNVDEKVLSRVRVYMPRMPSGNAGVRTPECFSVGLLRLCKAWNICTELYVYRSQKIGLFLTELF